MTESWRPLSVREDETAAAEFAGPHEGVPDWLLGPLWSWLVARYPLTFSTRNGWSWSHDAVDKYRRLAMVVRTSIEDPQTPNPSDARILQARLFAFVNQDHEALLDIVDYALSTVDFSGGYLRDRADAPSKLDVLLADAGSVWSVQRDSKKYLLARRVAPEIQATANRLMEGKTKAAEYLRQAWQATYGRRPNPGDGYRTAVLAVEAASIPIVSPANARATLGTVIRDMRARPSKWVVSLQHHSPADQVHEVIGMLDLLWVGQTGRHADPDPTSPLDVSREQAEAGLNLALALVAWFSTGVISVA